MLRLYVVRHGRTLFNEKHMIQGWCDAPLTNEGITQAKALNIGLKNENFIACYSSPLYRAVSTARYILKDTNVSIELLFNLIEINFGHIEGDSDSKLKDIYPIYLGQKVEGYDGDTIQQLTDRVLAGLEEIARKHDDGNILVTTHSGAITALLTHLASLDINKEYVKDKDVTHVDNCSVTIIERVDNSWKVVDLNNTEYRDKGLKQL